MKSTQTGSDGQSGNCEGQAGPPSPAPLWPHQVRYLLATMTDSSTAIGSRASDRLLTPRYCQPEIQRVRDRKLGSPSQTIMVCLGPRTAHFETEIFARHAAIVANP